MAKKIHYCPKGILGDRMAYCGRMEAENLTPIGIRVTCLSCLKYSEADSIRKMILKQVANKRIMNGTR
jgi:hypothetical protein